MNALPLVYISCGRGLRVAHLDRPHPRGGWRGHVWIDAAHRWTWSTWIRASRLLGAADLRDPHVKRALGAATPGRPPCRHTHHGATELAAVAHA